MYDFFFVTFSYFVLYNYAGIVSIIWSSAELSSVVPLPTSTRLDILWGTKERIWFLQ